jgi:hypothetical protein
MSIFIGCVNTFAYNELPSPRDQALKVLEEAAELFGVVDTHGDSIDDVALRRECSDVIQAVCNLLVSFGYVVLDLEPDMLDCRKRNENRGRVYHD